MSTGPTNKSGCLGLLLRIFGGSAEPSAASFPFRLRDDFLSPAEMSFYHVLISAAGEKHTVCPKVNLNDIFFVSRPDQNQAARNRISRKHIDFLLCDSRSMRPCVGVELDDSSHATEKGRMRDALVEQVFAAAGLPLVRFPARRAYNVSEVTSLLAVSLGKTPNVTPVTISEDPGSPPLCPKCGIPMVGRRGSRGEFYGCSNYPRCRETAELRRSQ